MTEKNTKTNYNFTPQDKEIINEWKLIRQIKPNTYRTYKHCIYQYTQATQMTITELYDEAIQEEDNHTPKHRKKLKKHLLEYREYLDQQQLSDNTKTLKIKAVRSFYQAFDIRIPQLPNNYDATPDMENVGSMITEEIIRLMIDNASIRNKAIIMFVLLTGQSPDEICHLRIQDFVDAWNTQLAKPIFTLPDIFKYKEEILELDCPSMRMYRRKTNTRYWIYIPSELSRVIIDYIYERSAGRNQKLRITGFDDWLFKTKMGTKMTSNATGKAFSVTASHCGFDTPELFNDETRLLLQHTPGKHHIWTAYHYRKYFLNMCRRYAGTRHNTQTQTSYVGQDLGDFWIGHKQQGSISHYIQYNEDDIEELRVHYKQALPYLSIERKVDVMTAEDKQRLQELEEKYGELEKQYQLLAEFMEMKKQLEGYVHNHGYADEYYGEITDD